MIDAAPHRASEVDGRYAWLRLVMSVLIATIGSVGAWAVVVAMPSIEAEFGSLRGEASLAYTLTMVGFGAGNLLVGNLVDRMGIRLPMIGSAVLLLVGFSAAAAAPSLFVFALAQILIGLGGATAFGPLIADISHWFAKRRGVAVAAAASGNYFAGAVWPLAMQPFLAEWGWRATYMGIGIFCIVTIVPLSLIFLAKRAPDLGTTLGALPKPILSIDLSPRQLQMVLAVAGIGCCVAMSMPQVHIVAYCVDLGFGVGIGAEMLSLMLVGGVISRLASGFLADRIGGVRTLLIGSVFQALALAAYIPFDGLASLYVVSLVFGLSQGGIVPAYAIIIREYLPAAEAGRRVGFVIMATIGGMALGGWMSGAIYDLTGSYQAAFLNGIAWNLMNVVIMTALLWRTRRHGRVTV